jgi:hypothetical protein
MLSLQSGTFPVSATLIRRNCALYASSKINGIGTCKALTEFSESGQEPRVTELFGCLSSPIAVELAFQLMLNCGCDGCVLAARET